MTTELDDLVSGRWDPRRGVGPRLGRVRWLLTWLLLGVLVFGRFVPRSVGGMSLEPLVVSLFVLPIVGLIACWLLPASIRSRTRRRYAAHGGLLCPWCRYPLTGVPGRGRCPECGSGFDPDACRTLYDAAYRAFRPDAETLKQRERGAWVVALREKRRPGDTIR